MIIAAKFEEVDLLCCVETNVTQYLYTIARLKNITRQVWLLSAISLCNDAASEMLTPILPLYLKHVGYGMLAIGIIEGVAEATAGVGKIYFGALSDALGKRVVFIQAGYALSAFSKPLMGIFISPWWILLMRITDRVGKGLRTAPRDALLSAQATTATKGEVFGFHRSMDTLGAVIGPLAALAYLYYQPQHYDTVFLIAALPGLLTILCTTLLTENNIATGIRSTKAQLANFWQQASPRYKQTIVLLLFFALANSSDAFLLLKLKASGCTDLQVILCYVLYNAVYVAAAFPLGKLGDRVGLEKLLTLGLIAFGVTYFAFGVATTATLLVPALVIYGVYAACAEGIAKAIITNSVPQQDAGKAIGFYTAAQSTCIFLASTATGLLWQMGYVSISFYISGAIACLVAVLLWRLKKLGTVPVS